jgi:PAS domain S-box-containing protein
MPDARESELAGEVVALRRRVAELERALAERRAGPEGLTRVGEATRQVSRVGAFRADVHGNLLHVNDDWCEITGLARAEVLGRGWLSTLSEEDRANLLERLPALASDRAYRGEYHYRRPDGREIWIESDSTVELDAAGRPTGVIVTTIVDVTARKLAEEEARESQRHMREQLAELEAVHRELRLIKEHLTEAQHVAGVGSWEWDLLDDRAWWSDELYRIFGRDKEHTPLSFEDFLELVHPDDQVALRKHFEATFSRSEPSTFEFRFVRDTGAVRVIRTSSLLERTPEGVPARLVGTVQDVTERRRVEAALGRERAEG